MGKTHGRNPSRARGITLTCTETPPSHGARKLPPMLHLETRGRAMRRSAPSAKIRSWARPTGVIPRARAPGQARQAGGPGSAANDCRRTPKTLSRWRHALGVKLRCDRARRPTSDIFGKDAPDVAAL